MKHPITLRLAPDLLAMAKGMAKAENRTLTNFIETLLKQRFASGGIPAQSEIYDDSNPTRHGALTHENEQSNKGAH